MAGVPVPGLLVGRRAALARMALLAAPAAWAQQALPEPPDGPSVPKAAASPTPDGVCANRGGLRPLDLAPAPSRLGRQVGASVGRFDGLTPGMTAKSPLMQLTGPNLGLQLDWAQPWGLARWTLQAQGLISAPNYSSPVSGTIDRRATRETAWRALDRSGPGRRARRGPGGPLAKRLGVANLLQRPAGAHQRGPCGG